MRPPLLRWAGAQGPAGSQAGQEQGLEAFFSNQGCSGTTWTKLVLPLPPLFSFFTPLKFLLGVKPGCGFTARRGGGGSFKVFS